MDSPEMSRPFWMISGSTVTTPASFRPRTSRKPMKVSKGQHGENQPQGSETARVGFHRHLRISTAVVPIAIPSPVRLSRYTMLERLTLPVAKLS